MKVCMGNCDGSTVSFLFSTSYTFSWITCSFLYIHCALLGEPIFFNSKVTFLAGKKNFILLETTILSSQQIKTWRAQERESTGSLWIYISCIFSSSGFPGEVAVCVLPLSVLALLPTVQFSTYSYIALNIFGSLGRSPNVHVGWESRRHFSQDSS